MSGRKLIVISISCVASMHPKVYLPVCVYDAESGIQLPVPDSKCDCVCGFECSHRFASGDLLPGFLQILPDDTTYDQLSEYMPDPVNVIMSEPIPIDYIFGLESDQ